MANSILLADVFQSELDKQLSEKSTTGWMEDNAKNIVFVGGRNIKIPKISFSGLADYSRDSGFVNGNVNLTYENFTLSKDRGRRFIIDANDVDESNFALTAASIISEFQRTKVIPEIDAYRYSRIVSFAPTSNVSEKLITSDNIFDSFMDSVASAALGSDYEGELIAAISRSAYDLLVRSPDIRDFFENSTLAQGELNIDVRKIGNAIVYPVPNGRFYSAVDITASGDGGFKSASNAKSINWIVMPKDAPLAISKTESVRIISPDVNQSANGWAVDYRKYHDLIVPNNKCNAIVVCLQA